MNLRVLVMDPPPAGTKIETGTLPSVHFSVVALLDPSEPWASESRVHQNSQGQAGFGAGLPHRFPVFTSFLEFCKDFHFNSDIF